VAQSLKAVTHETKMTAVIDGIGNRQSQPTVTTVKEN